MKYVFLETGNGRLQWRDEDDINTLTRYINNKLGDLCKFVKKVTITKDGYRDKKGKTEYFFTIAYDFIRPIGLPRFSKVSANFKLKTDMKIYNISRNYTGEYGVCSDRIVFKLKKKTLERAWLIKS